MWIRDPGWKKFGSGMEKNRFRDGKVGSGIRNAVFFTILIWIVQDDPPLPEDDENKEKRTDDISSWDADFLKVLLVPFFLFLRSVNPVRTRFNLSFLLQISYRKQYLTSYWFFQTTTLHISFKKSWMLRFGSNIGFLTKFLDAEDTKHCLQIVCYFALMLISIRTGNNVGNCRNPNVRLFFRLIRELCSSSFLLPTIWTSR
jgi:hypothetical protein